MIQGKPNYQIKMVKKDERDSELKFLKMENLSQIFVIIWVNVLVRINGVLSELISS